MNSPFDGPELDCRTFRRRVESEAFGAAADVHSLTCATCREWLEARRSVESALSRLRAQRCDAPASLDNRVAAVGASAEFVGSILRHLAPRSAPAVLDWAVLDPSGRALDPSLTSQGRRRFARSRGPSLLRSRPALRVAALLVAGVGLAWIAGELVGARRPKFTLRGNLVHRSLDEVPEALRASLDFLAGGVGGSRKG